MTFYDISTIRLYNQKIERSDLKTASEVVSWMGALQAQDYSMAKWALGVRFRDSTDESIEAAIERGEIIRTHVMRPTWHFVSADDIYWMLELSAPQIKSSLKSRYKGLELTESILARSNQIIEKALSKESVLDREGLVKFINEAKIRTDENRLSHLLMNAEIEGLICSRNIKTNKPIYSLLREKVPFKKPWTRNESLLELARRYFQSHSPATLKDFEWWSGLSHRDAKQATESIRDMLITEKVNDNEYYVSNLSHVIKSDVISLFLLPAYDEFLISYSDRSPSLSLTNNKKTVSNNGIFYPVIIVNGQVAGLWKRQKKNEKITIVPQFFQPPDKTLIASLRKKASLIGKFLNTESELSYIE